MPKFMKQVRNFLNNSPFKMYNKPAPLKVKGAYVKKGGKATGNMKDYAIGSKSRYNEYESRGWKQDDTTKGGATRPAATAPATAPAIAPATSTETRNANSISGSTGRDNSADAIKRRAQATAADNKAKNAVEDADTARIARKKIADKARIAMNKKKAAAAGQTQNMKDKIKLKADIKTLRKNKKGNTTEKGDTKSNKDLLKEKRKEKRGKRKAIRKYKNNPDNMKVAKVKKDKKSKVNARTPSGNSGQAFVGEKPKKASATKMYKKKK
jgi:hypothetical protein